MTQGQTGKRRRAKGAADVRRDIIIRGLNSVLRTHPQPNSLRMQDLADHLGFVKGNLYYYFKDKEELIYHSHLKCMEMSLDALRRAKLSRARPRVKLRKLIAEHILALTKGDYSAVLRADMENISPVRRRKYVKLRDEFEHGVRGLIQQGVAEGEFVKQDVRIAGFAILGAINWIPKWYRPDGELAPEAIAEQFSDAFMRLLGGGG